MAPLVAVPLRKSTQIGTEDSLLNFKIHVKERDLVLYL